jgi:excinuclease ABC subunit C
LGSKKTTSFDGKSYATKLPTRPGVYLMRDEAGEPLYVGKARNLRKRVGSYFDARPKIERIMRMVARIRHIEVSLTRTEGEALLLENEWIKSLGPRYNILLRDDKSYPWIVLSTDHPFPRIGFHRGARDSGKRYFGPYPSAGSVRESINLIQKLFRIRNCEDSYYAHRNRPCLQHQIPRCTAPCVGLVSRQLYAEQVSDATLCALSRPDQYAEADAGTAIRRRQPGRCRFCRTGTGTGAELRTSNLGARWSQSRPAQLLPQPGGGLRRRRGDGGVPGAVLPGSSATGPGCDFAQI